MEKKLESIFILKSDITQLRQILQNKPNVNYTFSTEVVDEMDYLQTPLTYCIVRVDRNDYAFELIKYKKTDVNLPSIIKFNNINDITRNEYRMFLDKDYVQKVDEHDFAYIFKATPIFIASYLGKTDIVNALLNNPNIVVDNNTIDAFYNNKFSADVNALLSNHLKSITASEKNKGKIFPQYNKVKPLNNQLKNTNHSQNNNLNTISVHNNPLNDQVKSINSSHKTKNAWPITHVQDNETQLHHATNNVIPTMHNSIHSANKNLRKVKKFSTSVTSYGVPHAVIDGGRKKTRKHASKHKKRTRKYIRK